MVFTLVYLSTLLRPMTHAELVELLLRSRDRNAGLGVTGMLVQRGRSILQLLEGEERVVRDLYERIAVDRRHHGLFTLWTGTADHRRFPDWTMGYDEGAGGADDGVAGGPAAGQGPRLESIVLHGTAEQRRYVRRRDDALREALVGGERLIRTLSVVLHGHDPETGRRADGTTYLRCRECHLHAEDADEYPCSTAQSALRELETVNARNQQRRAPADDRP